MKVPADLENVFRIAGKSDSTVLISGATGTGKTSLAKQIHEQSQRRDRPFIVVNLASLHEGTLESELFGHERGSFTGADQKRVGRIELAEGGTLFLDEIGELSLRLQARLLEFLQSRTFSPVGSNREIRMNIRVIAATHRNLEKAVLKGEFREDLFHRVRVIPIALKSLHERVEEIESLTESFLSERCPKEGKPVFKISDPVMKKFKLYRWPGNIRELRNVLEYAILAAGGSEIHLSDLPEWFLKNFKSESCAEIESQIPVLGTAELPFTLDFQKTYQVFEKDYLCRALHRFGGRINHTARAIGMSKTTLIRRLRFYGISAFDSQEGTSKLQAG
jgi:DNA-binding NtrC family response regulator